MAKKEEGKLPRSSHGRLTPLDDMRDALGLNYYLFVLAWSSMYQQLIEEQGDKGRRLAARASEDVGRKWGQAMLDVTERQKEKTSIPDIAKAYSESMQYFGYDNTIVESSDTRAVIRVTKCPLLEHWRRQYPSLIPHACYVEPYIDIGSFRYINPNVRVNIPCKLSEGAAYSDYVITLDQPGKKGAELLEEGNAAFEHYLMSAKGRGDRSAHGRPPSDAKS